MDHDVTQAPSPSRSRTAAARLAAVLLALGFSACMSDGNLKSPMDAQEEKEDEKAKVEYYTDAAKTYYEGGKYEAAVRMWEKVIAAEPGDQWAQFGLAKALHMTGTVPNLRRAEKILLDLQNRDWQHPTQGDVRFRVQTTLAAVYSDLADYFDRDIRALDARLEEEPSREIAADILTQKQKQIAIRNDLLQKSIPLFEQVLIPSKEDPYALAGLAKANLVLGRDAQGIAYAKRYLALSQRSQKNYRDLMDRWPKLQGSNLTEEQRGFYVGKIQGARDKEKAMHLLLGSVYMRRDEYADAVAEYDAVLALDSALPAAYVERAQAYARLNQYPLAVRDLEEYLKLTDPVRQRAGRLNAAELLERYTKIVLAQRDAARGGLQPASASRTPVPAGGGFPAPAPGTGAAPPAFPPGPDIGSPDGVPAPPPPPRR